MHQKFKPHAQKLGKVFFLDVPNEDILKYLNKKTTDAANSIVGKHEGVKNYYLLIPELHETWVFYLENLVIVANNVYKLHKSIYRPTHRYRCPNIGSRSLLHQSSINEVSLVQVFCSNTGIQ